MKNLFNKTALVMLVAGLLCTMVATGCTNSNGNNTATENTTKSTSDNTIKNETEASSTGEVFTIKAGPYTDVDDLGITAETTNSNHYYLDTHFVDTTPSEVEYTTEGVPVTFNDLTDERIKDIYHIYMGYRVNEPKENGVFEYSETELDEKIKLSIPYEEGVYLLHCKNGVAYDVNAEYIDGKYVLETDQLGSFMFSTEPAGRTEPVKTENIELAQQTLVDEASGVKVSGMLPVDAEMDVLLYFCGSSLLHDFYLFQTGTVEDDYPKAEDVSEFCYVDYNEKEIKNEFGTIAETISEKGWTNRIGEDGKLEAKITFIKDFEILEFESDLTITLPFDYRQGLINGSRIGKASAMQYDYNNKEFVTLDLVAENDTPEGTYQFKAKAPGQFFIGDDIALNSMVKAYTTNTTEEAIQS